MKITGGESLRAQLEQKAEAAPAAVNRALVGLGRELLAAAQQAAPRDSGELEASGYTEEVAPGVVAVGFRADHAAAVHERLDVTHANGGAKFLERPQLELGRAMPDRLGAAVRDVVQGG